MADLEEESTAQELEARMIGQRIQEIVGQAPVLDKKTGEYRPAQYRDCVILLRTVAGWAETFVSVLMDMGIPAYATSKTGYFSAPEMVTLLNYLHICDNPMQEIPFTGVLASPLVGCTPEELAMIKNEFPQGKIYEGAWKYREEGQCDALREKLCGFFSKYERIRERIPNTPIHELIQLILRVTGFDLYAAAMPGGEQRKPIWKCWWKRPWNMRVPVIADRSILFGIWNNLQKYQVDFGEVNIAGENENTVLNHEYP